MTEDEKQKHCYLGDGVYIEITSLDLILRTGDHREGLCSNQIHIDSSVLGNLVSWLVHQKVLIFADSNGNLRSVVNQEGFH